jgi:hypothetical protein
MNQRQKLLFFLACVVVEMGPIAEPEGLHADHARAAAFGVLAANTNLGVSGAIRIAVLFVPGLNIALITAGVPVLAMAPETPDNLTALATSLYGGAFANRDFLAPLEACCLILINSSFIPGRRNGQSGEQQKTKSATDGRKGRQRLFPDPRHVVPS